MRGFIVHFFTFHINEVKKQNKTILVQLIIKIKTVCININTGILATI